MDAKTIKTIKAAAKMDAKSWCEDADRADAEQAAQSGQSPASDANIAGEGLEAFAEAIGVDAESSDWSDAVRLYDETHLAYVRAFAAR